MLHSKKLSRFKNLIHGFTTKEEGDYKKARKASRNSQQICQTICEAKDLVLPEQVHGDRIAIVDKENKEKVVKGADGLITKEKDIILGVTTADCLPLLFYEPKKKIIANVHAGWRGTFKRVCQKAAEKIKDLGGDLSEVLVAVGPHIKKCCYDVDKRRKLMFRKKFGKEVVVRKNDKFFLDLTKANFSQLLETGVKEKNIEILPFCTYCHHQRFFSYRKNKGNNGEMLSFISMH